MNIVIIGTGNIGRRHLQAVSKLDYPVCCHDISQASLSSLKAFCEGNSIKTPELVDEFPDILERVQGSIVILATTANGRADLLKKILLKKPLAVIAEKPLTQSLTEYRALLDAAGGIAVYVNCPRHLFPIYQEIKQHPGPVFFYAVSSHSGMASNNIHLIELFSWLSGANEYSILHSDASKPYETKRAGFFDFSGLLAFKAGESICILQDTLGESAESIQVTMGKKQYTIFEAQKKVAVVDQTGLHVMDIQIPYVSGLTNILVEEIVSGKKASLPTIQEAYLAHQVLFEYMERHGLTELNIT